MSKLQSRKFFAFIVWIIFMAALFVFSRDNISIAIPWFGGITSFYVSTQAAIDAIKAWKGGGDV